MLSLLHEFGALAVGAVALTALAALWIAERAFSPFEDVGAASDAGGCHRCGTNLPARQIGGHWECPTCRVRYDSAVRVLCAGCGRRLSGPLYPHEAALHRYGVCDACLSRPKPVGPRPAIHHVQPLTRA